MFRLVITFITALFLSSILYSQSPDNVNLKITHGPYLQNVGPTSATIMWLTNKAVLPSVILSSQGEKPESYYNSTDGIVNAGSTINKVRIEGLSPGTKYVYIPVSKEIMRYQAYRIYYGDTLTGGEFSFTTLSPLKDKISFSILNDIHERSGLMAKFIRNSNIKNSDLVFLNGDMINYLQDEEQIFNGFLDTAVYYFAKETPMYLVRGNHETRGMKARSLKDYFDFKEDRFYYSMTHGPVHFVVLDCGEDKADDNRYYYGMADYDAYRLKELEWLKAEIQSKEYRSAKYRVFIVHMPVIKGEDMGHGMLFLSDHFGPVLEKAGVDILIAAHTHRVAFHSSVESGFGYPVIVSSNNTFIEADADMEKLQLRIKDAEGGVVLEKEINR